MSKNDAEAVIDILKVHAQQYNETEKTIDILVSIEGLEKVALSFQPNEIRALLPFLKLELNKDNSGDNVELRCTSAKLISDDQGSAKLLVRVSRCSSSSDRSWIWRTSRDS